MPLPTGLRRDSSGIWHLRIGVPENVRPYWPPQPNGKPAIDALRKSLRTRDRAEAVAHAHGLIAEHHRKFASLLDRNRPQRTQLTQKLVEYLQNRIKYELLEGDDIRRVGRRVLESVPMDLVSDLPEELTNAERLQLWARVVRNLQANGEGQGLTMGFVDKLLQHMGLPPADWTGQAKAVALLGRTLAQTYTIIAERSEGAIIETPASPGPYASEEASTQPRAVKTPPRTLRDAVNHWVTLTNAKPNAIQRTNRALLLWEDAVGAVPLDQITRETGGEFVLYLLDDDRDFKRKTAANHAPAISALMTVAVKQGLAQTNPLDLKFTVDDSESREPWTQQELIKLHGQPVRGEQPLEVDSADADLLINMLLWSGARISEIAGLRVQDVQERDGIVAAFIRRETTKNDQSVRWLPIASALRQRVLDHVKRRRDEGSDALLRSFHRRAGTSAGDLAGRWFREHRERLGLPQGALHGSHRWRHTVRTKLASEGLGEALLDAVTGHQAAGGSAGRKSYTHVGKFPLAKVLEAIERLAWPWPRPGELA